MVKKIKLTILLILLTAVITSGQKCVKPIRLDKGPHFFIDDYLIANDSFIIRTVNNPHKLKHPIITSGTKGDQNWQPYLSVLRDPQTHMFRIWYNTPVDTSITNRCHIGYMESKDGIHWIGPPKILKDPLPIQFGVTVLDRGVNYKNPSKRYVLATYLKPGFRVSTSPDGIHWTSISDKPVFLHNHDITTLAWDPIRKRYIAVVSNRLSGFGDPSNPSIDDKRRIPHETVSKDLLNWKPIWPIIMPMNDIPKEHGETQFYSMSGIITRGDLMIGLVKILRDDLNATPGKTAKQMGDMHRKAAGLGYTVLAWSRDGVTWERDYQAFIPRNPIPGTFDHAMSWGDEQIIVGNKTYVYYAGYKRGHKINRFHERQIGLAIMKKDRYVSRDAGMNKGEITTKPVVLIGSSLSVNANVIGYFKVRILKQNCQPISGFGWVNVKGNNVDIKVDWKKDLRTLHGKPVRLQFKMKNAQLFCFYIK